MKKIFILLCGLVVLFVWFFSKATQAVAVDEIRDDEIYVFVQKGCRHCTAAEEFLKKKYPDLKVQIRDISETNNRMMFFGCGAKFGLNRSSMGTPLFCMGKNHILGWSYDNEKAFNEYVRDFLPQN